MADQWYLAKGGQQRGPLTLEQMQAMAAGGQIAAGDLVWREGMANWAAASTVAEIWPAGTAPTAQPLPAPLASVAYEAPSAEPLLCTATTIELYRQTKRWVRIVSVYLWIGVFLMAVGGLIAFGVAASAGRPEQAAIMVVYVLMAILYVAPAVLLSNYATRLGELTRLRRSDVLEQAVQSQKSFWKYVAICMLVVTGLYAVLILFAIVSFALRV